MNPRMRRVLILTAAALLLIALANGILLWNVARNRTGTPTAELLLSERELLVQQSWREENSGRFLRLRYQYVRSAKENEVWQTNPWLDKTKLQSLGYRFRAAEDEALDIKNLPRLPQKPAFLVLELDGKAYQEALAQAAAEVKSLRHAAKPEGLQRATEQLRQIRTEDSRLFVVDAGIDAEQLRQRHPNRQQYAIVPGHVRAWWQPSWQDQTDQEKRPKLSTYLGLAHDQIFVPLEYASIFTNADGQKENGQGVATRTVSRFQVRLAFGQRLEPWIKEMKTEQVEP